MDGSDQLNRARDGFKGVSEHPDCLHALEWMKTARPSNYVALPTDIRFRLVADLLSGQTPLVHADKVALVLGSAPIPDVWDDIQSDLAYGLKAAFDKARGDMPRQTLLRKDEKRRAFITEFTPLAYAAFAAFTGASLRPCPKTDVIRLSKAAWTVYEDKRTIVYPVAYYSADKNQNTYNMHPDAVGETTTLQSLANSTAHELTHHFISSVRDKACFISPWQEIAQESAAQLDYYDNFSGVFKGRAYLALIEERMAYAIETNFAHACNGNAIQPTNEIMLDLMLGNSKPTLPIEKLAAANGLLGYVSERLAANLRPRGYSHQRR